MTRRGEGVPLSPMLAQESSRSGASTPSSGISSNGCSDEGSSYFAQFSNFKENPDASLAEEMGRLGIQEQWSKKEKKAHLIAACDAEFVRYFGSNVSKLSAWQNMCRMCQIEPVPDSITKCKKALAKLHVNIFNFIDHCRNPTRVPLLKFDDVAKLRKYSVPKRIYPIDLAKKDTFIKSLLRPFGFTKRKKWA
ncbi:hypothetical protein ACEQ8H_006335 [Pleosporales sp. CAS-2024a]